MIIALYRLELTGWMILCELADRLWSTTKLLASWAGHKASQAEMRLAAEIEKTWNAAICHAAGGGEGKETK
jgi:hypothetical protein